MTLKLCNSSFFYHHMLFVLSAEVPGVSFVCYSVMLPYNYQG